jgi:hypothetical protein
MSRSDLERCVALNWQIDLEMIADVIENRLDPLVAELAMPMKLVEPGKS